MLRARTIWRLLCVCLTLLIIWLALVPSGAAPTGLGWDKLNHAAAIAAVTLVAYLSLHPRRRAANTAFLYGMFVGVLIEILQGALTTGRAAEWGDIAADLLGAASVWCLVVIFERRSALKQ